MFRGPVRVFFFGFGFLVFFPFNTSYRPIQQYEYIDLVLSATSIEAAVLPFRVVNRARVTRFQPSGDAVGMERVTADTPCHIATIV
jgi:hypothetical protein